MPLEILPPGTRVYIKAQEPFEAEIQSVTIFSKSCAISYEVFWWNGDERKQTRIAEHEVDHSITPKTKVGFKPI